MLVEDDKSLREIYDVRLRAEGYDIKYAGDGEEALAMAVKEHPDLIISDVMMPKISGFDMLDILRATPETKAIKVIMMTALSSEDQRSRGESLGADRYLVKSQVGIEDVVRTVHEVLGDIPGTQTTQNSPSQFNVEQTPVPTPTIQQPTVESTPNDSYAQNPSFDQLQTQDQNQTTPSVKQPTTEQTPITQNYNEQTVNAPITQNTIDNQQNFNNPDYAPQPVFNEQAIVSPVEPATLPIADQVLDIIQPTIQQPEIQPQPTTPSAPTTIKVIDKNEYPTELPQPTAPFSTPAPASLGGNLMNQPVVSPQSTDASQSQDSNIQPTAENDIQNFQI